MLPTSEIKRTPSRRSDGNKLTISAVSPAWLKAMTSHLYLGLYFEAQGNAIKAADYIAKAAKGHEAHGYMGQVARVHHEWLQQKVENKEVKPEK